MTSTIYTILYRGTPAQLVGILWDRDKGDTGLAVIRLKSEGRYLRAVAPSELSPLTTRNLRPAAAPHSMEWHVECLGCKGSYDQTTAQRPSCCGACGSRVINLTRKVMEGETNGSQR